MKSRLHLLFLLLVVLFVCPDAKAQFSRTFGWCEQGGQAIVVSGLPGAPLAQASYPQCTITVFNTGTTTPATIYSDKGITPLGGGTFQASANGYWFFYAATGSEVDIQESGAGLTTFTWGDVTVGNAVAAGNSLLVNNALVANPNFVNSTNFSFGVSGSLITGQLIGVPLLSAANAFTGQNSFALNPTLLGLPALSVTGNPVIGNCATFVSLISVTGSPCGGGGGGNLSLLSQDNPATTVTNSGNSTSKGPNPAIDGTFYGMRAVNQFAIPQTTATCTPGSTTITLTAPFSQPVVNGDGVVVYGCGSTNTTPTPGSPTVTNVVDQGEMMTGLVAPGAAGSTSYTYTLVARRRNGGITAQSLPTTTTTGQGTLGMNQFNITSETRSGTTVTVTTSASHNLLVGCSPNCGWVHDWSTSDPTFVGWFKVSSVADSTHFVYSGGMDTAAGAPASSTGGFAQTWPSNQVVAPPLPSGAYQYIVCRNGGLAGEMPPGETTWWDYGAPAPFFQDFISCPSAPTNDYLETIISSGAGTLTLSVRDQALNAPGGPTTIKQDNAAPFLTAVGVAVSNANGGTLRIPASAGINFAYVFNGHTQLPGNQGLTIIQDGCVVLAETMETPIFTTWDGNSGGSCPRSTQFSNNIGQGVSITTAFPGIASGFGSRFTGLTFLTLNNGLALTMNQPFNGSLDRDSFAIGSQSNGQDFTGRAVICYGCSNNFITNSTFNTSGPQSNYAASTPSIFIRTDIANVNPGGKITFQGDYWNQRGVAIYRPGFGGNQFNFELNYIQSATAPVIAMQDPQSGSDVYINSFQVDTSPAQILYWGGAFSGGVEIHNVLLGSVDPGSFQVPGIVTGNMIPSLEVENGPTLVGQNRNMVSSVGTNLFMNLGTYAPSGQPPNTVSSRLMNVLMHSAVNMPWQFDMLPPTNVGCAVSAGGSAPIGSNAYVVNAVDINGGDSDRSQVAVCTTTTGNQTDTITWNAVTGAKAYNVYRGPLGLGAFNGVNTCQNVTTLTCVDTFNFTSGPSVPTVGVSGAGLAGLIASGPFGPCLTLSSPLNSNPTSFTTQFCAPNQTANRVLLGADGAASVVLSASLVTTAAATDTVTIQGITASSHCQISPTNAAAATNYTTTFLSTPTANSIVVNHAVTANMNYSLTCSVN